MNTIPNKEHMTFEDLSSDSEYYEDSLVTCDNCGYQWDGYAQCSCHGIPLDEYSDDECSHDESKVTSSHTMTLRSHTTKSEAEATMTTVEEPLIHPKCWNAHTHYGQCGQSCPCCRAEIGDEWGACLVCINK
jgi:hypothetical protein